MISGARKIVFNQFAEFTRYVFFRVWKSLALASKVAAVAPSNDMACGTRSDRLPSLIHIYRPTHFITTRLALMSIIVNYSRSTITSD